MDCVVIALGGNALLDPSGKQSFLSENRSVGKVSKSIVELYKKKKYRIIITHGNGSQIGDELMRNEHAKSFIPKLPVYAINAETQASIGTLIETSIISSMASMKAKGEVCVILTHVLVDGNDPAFKRPLKQVGPFYTKSELQKELKIERFDYIKHQSKYRRVIASPLPKIILESDVIAKSSHYSIVVACGGGGIPVIRSGSGFAGVDAVIDKDLTTQLLASSIGADKMVLLTNAEYLYANWGKSKKAIKEVSSKELRKKLDQFEEGTIRPKAEACIRFIENGGKEAYIGNVFKLELILERKSGTRIIK